MKRYTVVYLLQKSMVIAHVESGVDPKKITIPEHPEAQIVAVFAGKLENLLGKK